MAKKFLTPISPVPLSADPASATAGQLYYNNNSNVLKFYNGTSWIALANAAASNLSVVQVNTAGEPVESYSAITSIQFDEDSGFDVTSPSAGVAKIAMNSTFKYWQVDGVQKLEATGLDTVNFVGGTGITITGNGLATPQSISFAIDTTETADLSTAQTLTNKTLTSPIIDGNGVVFEGATANEFETTLTVTDPTADRTITLPDVTGTVITTGDTGTVTNTMLAGSIANNKLANSSITINGFSISLGGEAAYSTDNIQQGTINKYFSDELAQDAVGNSVGNGLDYDDTTGAISVDPSEFTLNSVGTPTANVDMGTYKITNLGTPTAAGDAATKAYVDNTTAGLNFHAAVHAATTANLDATYNNGTSGVGATLTANSNGALIIDGHTLSSNERVLVKNQAAGLQNGIYVVTATGDESNPFILTRATDADNSPAGELAYGDFTFVQQGAVNGGFGYIINTTGTITIGSTSISYVQFNAGQTVVAGNGLTETTPGTLAINTGVTVDLNTAQTLTNKNITGSFTGNLTGNADTVTNGVYTSGSYSNPSWLTSLGWNKISSTPTTISGYGITDAATLTGSETLTNKTINGSNNTITNIGNSSLTNSSITINGSSVSLGGSISISSLPTQTGNSGKYLTTDGSTASWATLSVPITTGTGTISAGTPTTIDSTALSSFTSIEYMVSLKQGSKIRTSKVIIQTDGTSVDSTEFAIVETGGTMTGVSITGTASGSNALLRATVTDADSTNVDVKFSKVAL